MAEEQFVVDELLPTECVWDNEEKEQLFPDEVAKLLNKKNKEILILNNKIRVLGWDIDGLNLRIDNKNQEIRYLKGLLRELKDD